MGSYLAWAGERAALAQSLGRGELGGSYADGAIILSAAIAAMASLLWEPSPETDKKRKRFPGTDRKRFVEIVTRFRIGGPDTTRVSAPLLAAKYPQFQHSLGISERSLCLTGYVDKMEGDVHAMCVAANIPKCENAAREHSYANILYKQVRCGFIHEYRPGKSATAHDDLREIAGVESDEISYVNMLEKNDGVLVEKRLIHFPLKWISAAALVVAAGMDDECSKQHKTSFKNLGLAFPNPWWLDERLS